MYADPEDNFDIEGSDSEEDEDLENEEDFDSIDYDDEEGEFSEEEESYEEVTESDSEEEYKINSTNIAEIKVSEFDLNDYGCSTSQFIKKEEDDVQRPLILDGANLFYLGCSEKRETLFAGNVLSILRLLVHFDFEVHLVLEQHFLFPNIFKNSATQFAKLIDLGLAVETPNGQYDDQICFIIAREVGGTVLSNDKFLDLAVYGKDYELLIKSHRAAVRVLDSLSVDDCALANCYTKDGHFIADNVYDFEKEYSKYFVKKDDRDYEALFARKKNYRGQSWQERKEVILKKLDALIIEMLLVQKKKIVFKPIVNRRADKYQEIISTAIDSLNLQEVDESSLPTREDNDPLGIRWLRHFNYESGKTITSAYRITYRYAQACINDELKEISQSAKPLDRHETFGKSDGHKLKGISLFKVLQGKKTYEMHLREESQGEFKPSSSTN